MLILSDNGIAPRNQVTRHWRLTKQKRIQGDSRARRIPPALAAESGLAEDSVIELALVAGKLVITPTAHKPTLDELFRGVTADNIHGVWDTGPAWEEW